MCGDGKEAIRAPRSERELRQAARDAWDRDHGQDTTGNTQGDRS